MPPVDWIEGSLRSQSDYVVIESRRGRHFAGKLGDRIEDRWIVERAGVRYEIRLPVRHSRVSRIPTLPGAGEIVRVDSSMVIRLRRS